MPDASAITRIGLFLGPEDAYAPFYAEALERFGVLHQRLERLDADVLVDLDVVLLAGRGSLSEPTKAALARWVRAGGVLVASGGLWGLESMLRVRASGLDFSRSTIVGSASPIWPPSARDAVFFGGPQVESESPLLTTPEGHVVAEAASVGKGAAALFAPNVGATMALMQLGRSVEIDAIGPTDGSAHLIDGRLRAEDGIALDYDRDRVGESFGEPYADSVKEAWLRLILALAAKLAKPIVMTWPWPRGAEGAALVTFECQSPDAGHLAETLRHVRGLGTLATWLVAPPGFPPDVYRELRRGAHEIGLLFDAEPPHGWTEEKMKLQHLALSRNAGQTNTSSVRAKDGAWHGLASLYAMAEAAGPRVSLAKGGRQPGTSGFGFGTCHPFFPAGSQGDRAVIEVPYLAYAPGAVGSITGMVEAMRACAARHGCAQVAFPIDLADDPLGLEGLTRFVAVARDLEFLLTTPERLYQFERGRRKLRIRSLARDDAPAITLIAPHELEGLTLMVSGARPEAVVAGRPLVGRPTRRFGVDWAAFDLDLGSKTPLELQVRSNRLAA
jgi:hypothetical protein